jgi:hypothetical protein
MAGSQERGRQDQSLTLTLKLLRQVPVCTILLDDFKEGRVQLQLLLRQLRAHPGVIHSRP